MHWSACQLWMVSPKSQLCEQLFSPSFHTCCLRTELLSFLFKISRHWSWPDLAAPPSALLPALPECQRSACSAWGRNSPLCSGGCCAFLLHLCGPRAAGAWMGTQRKGSQHICSPVNDVSWGEVWTVTSGEKNQWLPKLKGSNTNRSWGGYGQAKCKPTWWESRDHEEAGAMRWRQGAALDGMMASRQSRCVQGCGVLEAVQ